MSRIQNFLDSDGIFGRALVSCCSRKHRISDIPGIVMTWALWQIILRINGILTLWYGIGQMYPTKVFVDLNLVIGSYSKLTKMKVADFSSLKIKSQSQFQKIFLNPALAVKIYITFCSSCSVEQNYLSNTVSEEYEVFRYKFWGTKKRPKKGKVA